MHRSVPTEYGWAGGLGRQVAPHEPQASLVNWAPVVEHLVHAYEGLLALI